MSAPFGFRTAGVEDTRSAAGVVASQARRGDLILLVGELGVGKTAFVQGFARELGITSPVTSPTFTLVHRYEGKQILHHVDVYRLERLNEVTDLGLPEMLDEGITVIEWGDAVLPALPADFLEVRLSYVGDTDPTYTDDARDLAFTVVGPSWSTRAATIRAALER
jgi:tRNA threonylcarbamoyladenosine biosynthesis protein TsaE